MPIRAPRTLQSVALLLRHVRPEMRRHPSTSRTRDPRARFRIPRSGRRLRYATPGEGIRRRRRGRGFEYRDARGRLVRERRTLARIRSLAIPPAWREVWISPSPHGHLQATGRDARGRKQYRYHPEWRERRDAGKFARLRELGAALPAIRRRVGNDLRREGLPRERVLAALVALLDRTRARVGNDEYARANSSYGIATLRQRHAVVEGARVTLDFRGKSGVEHKLELSHPRLAEVVRRCQELPGQRLFQYLDDQGRRRAVGSADVNRYLREAGGGDWTSKELRTWHATAEALARLRAIPPDELATRAEREAALARVVAEVADSLRNTRAVCRKHYVDPRVSAAFLADELGSPVADGPSELGAGERDLLGFLESRERGSCSPVAAESSSARSERVRACA